MIIKNINTVKSEKLEYGSRGTFLITKNDNSDIMAAYSYQLPNEEVKRHIHKTSDAIYYILKGTGLMTIEDETETIKAGDTIFIPKNAEHEMKNNGSSNLEYMVFAKSEFDTVFID
ncbi:MAG TPA: cupin domain-containing protein [Victivallales bacterium]|nr:cupin domain-containing protein [Victivallales bacterium]